MMNYLFIASHYEQFFADSKMKNFKIKPSFVDHEWPRTIHDFPELLDLISLKIFVYIMITFC